MKIKSYFICYKYINISKITGCFNILFNKVSFAIIKISIYKILK